MRIRVALVAVAASLCLAPVVPNPRTLASGKLDAAQSYDFVCSVVNKAEENWVGDNDVPVTIELKDAAGNVAVNPSTFQPATLNTEISPGEAAMLVVPANFVGTTSYYCWAQVPEEAEAIFGTFLVRDAQDRSTAATPLSEDLAKRFFELLGKAHEIDAKLDWLLGDDL